MKVFFTSPLYDGKLHWLTVRGLMQALSEFGPDIGAAVQRGSWLPTLRDLLTEDFISSGAEYMLCVDSDIGWEVSDLKKLLAHDLPFVAGCYAKKQRPTGRPDDVMFAPTGKENGDLKEAFFTAAGFMLIRRSTVLRMFDAYPETYKSATNISGGELHGLWSPITAKNAKKETVSLGEDYSFCQRWRQIGGEVWVDSSVKLVHVGEMNYYVP